MHWSFPVLHEATCRADPDLIRLVLEHKDAQKQSKRSSMVPDLLRRLADVSNSGNYVLCRLSSSQYLPTTKLYMFF